MKNLNFTKIIKYKSWNYPKFTLKLLYLTHHKYSKLKAIQPVVNEQFTSSA